MCPRFCITKIAYPIRPLFIGTRRVPNPKVVSTSSKPQRHWSRYDRYYYYPLNILDLAANSFYKNRKTVKVLVKNEPVFGLVVQLYIT
jgi:hypothetical protein